MINIAVLGYGTIGSGVVEVIDINGDSIAEKLDEEVNVKYVLDLKKFPGDSIMEKLVDDFNIILEDSEVEIIVETMGGIEPAYTFAKKALLAGKSVVTSNKELVADHGAELIEIAREKNVNFLFGASVGGGIPIIRPMNQALTADKIEEITGILNGTTNYILTMMSEEGLEFETALKNAQDMGYAERDPSADVDGFDACRKIAILTSLAYGKQVDFEDIHTEGIRNISSRDFKYANALGARIKLLASSMRDDKGDVYAIVAPAMIKEDNPLYGVRDVFNSILVKGNVAGDLMFYGSGAGKLPTASAVVADVIDIAKHPGKNIKMIWDKEKLQLADIKQFKHRFFVRVSQDDKVMDQIKSLFGDVEIVRLENKTDEFAFITSSITEEEFKTKCEQIYNVKNYIRVRY